MVLDGNVDIYGVEKRFLSNWCVKYYGQQSYSTSMHYKVVEQLKKSSHFKLCTGGMCLHCIRSIEGC